MKFSVIAIFTGVLPEHISEPYLDDLSLADVRQICEEENIPHTLSDPGDSEYSYLSDAGPDIEWFKYLTDLSVCTFMDRGQFKRFVSKLGAFAMDTFGGPLDINIVADIPMCINSNVLFEAIRVTPCPEISGQTIPIRTEKQWSRIKDAFFSAYGNNH